jgi:hypothetical protein
MSRQADIDQVLEAWFLDGPMEMPDRLFDGVLDRVERVPQRRLARLKLRFSDMSNTARLVAAGAAAVLVVGVGFAAFGRSPTTGPGATPSASPSTSPSAPTDGAVPEALQHLLYGPVRSEPPAPAGQERAGLELTATDFVYNQTLLRSTASATAPNEIHLVADTIQGGCQTGDEGTYRWSATPGGSKVTFELVDDACAARAAVVPGEWQRSACENADNDCIGPLEQGRYSSVFVDPFVIGPQGWVPRFDAVSYEVPDGWSNTADWPGFYDLKRRADPDGTGVYVVVDVVATSSAPDCPAEPDPSVGRSVDELVAWLTALPGVVASEPVPVTIGGLDGYRLDLSMDPAWTATCPFSQGQPTRPIFTDASAGDFHWALGPGTKERNYLLNSADGRALLIDIEAQDGGTFESLVDEATGVVESMVFTR